MRYTPGLPKPNKNAQMRFEAAKKAVQKANTANKNAEKAVNNANSAMKKAIKKINSIY